MNRTSRGAGQGNCSHSCGLLSSSQGMNEARKELCSVGPCFTVFGDMSHPYPSSVHPHVQAHISAQKHTHPLPCRHLHKCFICILPYSPTHSLVFACRHTHALICPSTHPHKYTSMHTQAHCRLYICADAHGNTNTNQCTLVHSRPLMDVHIRPYIHLHLFSCLYTYAHTPVHTCSPTLRT